jgi:hypothetical protein
MGLICLRLAGRKFRAWINLDQPGSTWINLDQPGSTWINLDQPGSTWINLDQPGSTWIEAAPHPLCGVRLRRSDVRFRAKAVPL